MTDYSLDYLENMLFQEKSIKKRVKRRRDKLCQENVLHR